MFLVVFGISIAVAAASAPISKVCWFPAMGGWVMPTDRQNPWWMCFKFVDDMTMKCRDAQNYCLNLKDDDGRYIPATLVEIDGDRQLEWIGDMIKDSEGDRWVGLELDGLGGFKYMSSDEVVYDAWCPGQPGNRTDQHGTFENCAVIVRHEYCLNDIPEDNKRKFICMWHPPLIPGTGKPARGEPPFWRNTKGEQPSTRGEAPSTRGEPPSTGGESASTNRKSPSTRGEPPPTSTRREPPSTGGESASTNRKSPSTRGEPPPTSTRRESPSTGGESASTNRKSPSTRGEPPPTSTRRESPSTGGESASTNRKSPSTRGEPPPTSTRRESPSTGGESASTNRKSPSTGGESPSTSTRREQPSTRGESPPTRGEPIAG
ncbi:hypothetical protein ScPMuIL_018858 [Solemya velum]